MNPADWGDDVVEVSRSGGPPRFIHVGPTREQKREALIGLARDSYVRGDITVESFEDTVGMILAGEPIIGRDFAIQARAEAVAIWKGWKLA